MYMLIVTQNVTFSIFYMFTSFMSSFFHIGMKRQTVYIIMSMVEKEGSTSFLGYISLEGELKAKGKIDFFYFFLKKEK